MPTAQEVKIGRITVRGQPWQKVHKTPYQSIKAGHGGPCYLGNINRMLLSRPALAWR
jgi:hypothetical protein